MNFEVVLLPTGLPVSFEISNNEILEALNEPLGLIIGSLRVALEANATRAFF